MRPPHTSRALHLLPSKADTGSEQSEQGTLADVNRCKLAQCDITYKPTGKIDGTQLPTPEETLGWNGGWGVDINMVREL
ncbi:hypothetical protein PInf_013244 [Phytophthora infestans]|nr:hypothetical protein PInf_013244 [Phytophthora infestans]